MNIKVLDSWLRDFVQTDATPQKIAELLSLSSVSVERLEKYSSVIPANTGIQSNKQIDYLYDIEITTNRPDLMSVIGLAREIAAVLKQNNIQAKFSPALTLFPQERKIQTIKNSPSPLAGEGRGEGLITIKNDPKLVNRICAVIMDVTIKPSPELIKHRLEATGIRSLNNLIDITNYVMRVTGHPTHVFDYDRIHTGKLVIRASRAGEKITTLDGKAYVLPGGDIVADDSTGRIVDLLGIMGLENSVVTNETKRILFFIDNNNAHRIRKTSMTLGIRTEAAVINEKAPDPELAWEALLYGIKLYEEGAEGKIVSGPIDIYPNKVEPKSISVTHRQIQTLMGVPISLSESEAVLKRLDFSVRINKDDLIVTPPTFRAKDIQIPQDVIEEIARIYGYHNIPDILPPFTNTGFTHLETDPFFWEDRVKDAMKYWGFTEVYTYPMVSYSLVISAVNEKSPEDVEKLAVKIANPLSEEFVYMRQSIIPSLIKVVHENKDHQDLKIFEIGNVYHKNPKDLPLQRLTFAGLTKKKQNSFFETKGLIEQIARDLGITSLFFALQEDNIRYTVKVYVSGEEERRLQNPDSWTNARTTSGQARNNLQYLGIIKILDDQTIAFELNFEELIKHATLKKTYQPPSIYPPVIEDLALLVPDTILTGDIITLIKKQSPLITSVTLLDKYEDTRTFHIVYQSYEKNLTNEEVSKIREKILKSLKEKLQVTIKE